MTLLQRFLADFGFQPLEFVFDTLIPSLLAILFGGLIGLQRERHERPAGLRTHALVCLGSTVFTLVSYLGFSQTSGFDTSRIAAGVVTGIGFIGAGAIFRQGTLVKGVTTAASIWISAAIGLALGTRLYYLAILVTVIGLFILSFLKNLENRIIHAPFYTVKITTAGDFTGIEGVKEALKDMDCDVKSKKYELTPAKDERVYSFQVRSRVPDFAHKVISVLSREQGIRKISIG